MHPGNRYYFEIYIVKGNLIKIGISKGTDFLEEVNLYNVRHLVIMNMVGQFIMEN